MNAYLISGLGADKRIFANLKFDENVEIQHINWLTPLKQESLVNYAIRLSTIIDKTKPFMLIGVSFGGMLAVEIAKILSPHLTIIISSTLKREYLPKIYKIAARLKLLNIFPASLLKTSNKFTQHYYFGTRTIIEKKLLEDIVNETDPHFLKWAIGAILDWKNSTKPERLFHIHGTHDRILYTRKYKPDFLISNGTHFMVYQHADEVSNIINRLIKKHGGTQLS